MRNTLLLFIAVVVGAASGCSKSDTPSDVVAEFLDAVRQGDSDSASTRLTPLALQRIKENDMDFAPPASETAQFRVGKVELEEDRAFVESVWIEQDADGQSYDEEMAWELKLTDAGWRISGMAAQVGPDQPPILVDFENPGQLMGAQNSAAPKQSDGISRQAQQPAQDPFNKSLAR